MTDLIRALIQVKTPASLFAFLSLVFLMAFRTRQVPELFFGLAKEKLTKERFAQLLHHFMLFGFIGFVLLCVVAVTGQILTLKTQARPLSLDDVKGELNNLSAAEDQKQAALKRYADALADIQRHELEHAIESLQKSIDAVPTLSAQTTLAYLYQKKGDQANAVKVASAAQLLANQRGDSLAQVRLEQLSQAGGAESKAQGMVGAQKKPLPEGGHSYEEAVSITPGLYVTTHELASLSFQYFKVHLKAGQTLRVDLRTPDTIGSAAGASIYDADGVLKTSDYILNERSALKTVQWSSPADGTVYFSIGNGAGAGWANSANVLYRISIQ